MADSRKIKAYLPKSGHVVLGDGGFIDAKGGMGNLVRGVCDHSIKSFGDVPLYSGKINNDSVLSSDATPDYSTGTATACNTNGFLLITRASGGAKKYFCVALNQGVATIKPVASPDDPQLPAIFRYKLWDLEQGNMELPKSQQFLTKDITIPPELIPASGLPGGTHRTGFLLTEPFYEVCNFFFDYNRRIYIEKRPRQRYEIENVPGSGEYSNFYRYPSLVPEAVFPAYGGGYIGAQDALLIESRPSHVEIDSYGRLDVMLASVAAENIRTAYYVDMWGANYTPKNHILFYNLQYRRYDYTGGILETDDITQKFKDVEGADKYPYALGKFTDHHSDIPDILRNPVRIVRDFNKYKIYVRRFESDIDKEKRTFDDVYTFTLNELSGNSLSPASLYQILRADTDNNPHKITVLDRPEGNTVDVFLVEKNVTLTEDDPVYYYPDGSGGGLNRTVMQHQQHKLDLKLSNSVMFSDEVFLHGWITQGSLSTSYAIYSGVDRADPLNIVLYGQLQQNGYDVSVYSLDKLIWQYNHAAEYGTENPWYWNPANPYDEADLVQYEAFYVFKTQMIQKNEIKWFVNINGQQLVIPLPTEIWEETNVPVDVNGNQVLVGLKKRLLDDHNKERSDRAKNGSHPVDCMYPLIPDPFLEKVAQYHVDDMIKTGVFNEDHTDSLGQSIKDRASLLGNPLQSITENCARIYKGSSNPLTEGDIDYVFSLWMTSPLHKKALTSPYADFVGFAYGYRPEDGYWYFAVEFAAYTDDTTVIAGVSWNSSINEWEISNPAVYQGKTYTAEDRLGYGFPNAMGVIYEQESWRITERSAPPYETGNPHWRLWENKIDAVYTNDPSPVDTNGDFIEPEQVPGYEMRDLSMSISGNLLMLSFLVCEMWVEKTYYIDGSGHRIMHTEWEVKEDLGQRVYQFYDLSKEKLIWNGKIGGVSGDKKRLTAGVIDLIGDFS